MKEIFRNKKWIAFFLAFILVVTVGVNSSDAFLWAVGDVEETASEESGTQAHSSDEEGGEGAPEAETGGENTEFAGEAGVTSGNQFITAEQKDFGTSDGQQASGEVCGVSRHPGQQLTEVQDVNVFYILFSQELVFNISDVVLGQLPGVERLDGTLTSAATSSRFHGFPLTNFRP